VVAGVALHRVRPVARVQVSTHTVTRFFSACFARFLSALTLLSGRLVAGNLAALGVLRVTPFVAA